MYRVLNRANWTLPIRKLVSDNAANANASIPTRSTGTHFVLRGQLYIHSRLPPWRWFVVFFRIKDLQDRHSRLPLSVAFTFPPGTPRVSQEKVDESMNCINGIAIALQ